MPGTHARIPQSLRLRHTGASILSGTDSVRSSRTGSRAGDVEPEDMGPSEDVWHAEEDDDNDDDGNSCRSRSRLLNNVLDGGEHDGARNDDCHAVSGTVVEIRN